MERHAEYKDSGVAWIGEIPAGWEAVPIKYLSSCNDDALSEDTDADFDFDYVDISSVSPGSIEHKEHMRFENAPSRARRLVQTDDVIISTVRTYLKAIAPIGQADSSCVVSTGFAVLRPHSIDSGFFKYALMDDGFTSAVEARSVGISYPAINASELVTLPIAVPNTDEQRAIATWLDEKTGEVDGLVADTERSIELLEEYRRSVISEAVTKGLDPSAPMKDSGVEWIGEIPAGWDAVAMKRLATIQSGATPDRERSDYWGGEIGWIKTGELQDCIIESAEEQITEAALAETAVVRFPKDTVLVAMYGQGKTRGMTGLLGFESTTNQACAGIIADDNQLLPRFLWWFMRGSYRAIREEALGSGQPNLSVGLISSWKVTVPPLAEQRAIAAHLDEATAAIDALIADKRAYVERLREYRKSLISEAVTGKFKVPGVV